MTRLSRRSLLVATTLAPLFPLAARANAPLGEVAEVTGPAQLIHLGEAKPMVPGDKLAEGDTALTQENALALLILETETRLNMGPATEVVLSKYLADAGGTITVGGAAGGALVFDRAEDLPPVDLVFQTAFGEIGVRGTRFFVGPSKDTYAVFCQRGQVVVSASGVTRTLGPGDGVDLTAGGAPTEVAQWGAPRIEAAFASVGLTP